MGLPRRRAIPLVLAAALLLLAHALLLARIQGALCIDDAYISFRYARNLVEGYGLVFNPGERVEGYTNFGWVMLMAGAAAAGAEPAVAGRVLNLALGGLLAAAAVGFLTRRGPGGAWAPALAALLLGTDGSLARWSQDGMETVLFSLLVLSGAARAAREDERGTGLPASAAWFAAAALVRPEGVLWFAASLALRGLLPGHGRLRGRRALQEASLFAMVFGPYFTWRCLYYGYMLPNTFYAKVGGTTAQAARGLDYAAGFLLHGRWAVLLLLVAPLLLRRRGARARWQRYFLGLAAVHVLYVVAVGGDWMGPGRFLVPVVALVALPTAAGAAALLADSARGISAHGVRLALLALSAAPLLFSSVLAERRSLRAERPFSESRLAVARHLREAARPGERLLTNEIGQLAYFTGLATDDLYGLTDPRIAHLEVRGMGTGKPGHEKMDFAYSLSRRPAWVVIPNVARTYQRSVTALPALGDYELYIIPEPLPHPAYQAVLHRRDR